MNENIKTKFYKMNLIISIAITVVGLAVFIGSFFLKETVIMVIFLLVGGVWFILGLLGTLLQCFTYYEITNSELHFVRFKKQKTVKLDNISKVLLYSTEYIIIDNNNKKFCKIDRGLVNADKILEHLTTAQKEILVKQF